MFSMLTRYRLGTEPGTPIEPVDLTACICFLVLSSQKSVLSQSKVHRTETPSAESSEIFLAQATSPYNHFASRSTFSDNGSDLGEHSSDDVYTPESPSPQSTCLSGSVPLLSLLDNIHLLPESREISPPVTPPPATSVKRRFSDQKTTTPSVSPTKKKTKDISDSGTATTKQSPLKGLFQFFKKGISCEEHWEQMKRAHEEVAERCEREKQLEDVIWQGKDDEKKENNKM